MAIKIETADDKKVLLNVNGNTVQINNSLDEMKSAMNDVGAVEFQYAEKIYNIGYINQASFGMITGRKVFNLLLIKKLIDVISPYNVDASNFRLDALAQHADWEKLGNFRSTALEYIHGCFPGVLRSQLRKLLAIGLEPMSDNKQKKYISHSLQIVTTILRLFIFGMTKGLWQAKVANGISLDIDQKLLLNRFFSGTVEFSIKDNFNLFSTLVSIESQHSLTPVLPELSAVDLESIAKTISPLNELSEKLDSEEYTLVDCATAEGILVIFFEQFGFLCEYRMMSIKGVVYEELHQQRKFFVHNYSLVEQHDMPVMDQFRYELDIIPTETIVMYKGDYRTGINLFPFVIDLNSFTKESQSKIYMYGKTGAKDALNYTFLEDSSVYQISKSGKTWTVDELNEEMGDLQKRKIAKLDMVYHQFMEAKTTLTQ